MSSELDVTRIPIPSNTLEDEIRGAIGMQHEEIRYVLLHVDAQRGRIRARCLTYDLRDVPSGTDCDSCAWEVGMAVMD